MILDFQEVIKSQELFIIIDGKVYNDFSGYFAPCGNKILPTKRLDNLYDAVSYHGDMQVCKIDNRTFVCENTVYSYYKPYFFHKNLIQGSSAIGGKYPNNIGYNALITDKFAMHNFKYTDKAIISEIDSRGLITINVNQGYTKCSCVIVNSNAIITGDAAIAKILYNNSIDVLFVSNDNIILKGFSNGFIGGTSGLIKENLIAFAGSLKYHEDGNKIIEFCNSYGVDITYMYDGPLIDVGSIISIY